jgi:hypothetical protein
MNKLLWALLLLVAIVVAIPAGAYWAGMDNALGKPIPPDAVRYSETQAREVWVERELASRIAVRRVTPWHFYHLIWCSRNDAHIEDYLSCGDEYPGLRAAGYVAKRFLAGHLKEDGLMWRYLSRTALTIWITRNWSEQELVAELIRLKRTPEIL